MIIKKLVLQNFGIYAGSNTFSFEGNKPVVLIGGKNGRGKTTFLEAILLVLYGANSFLFKESQYRTYQQYLRSFINRSAPDGVTSIQIEFLLEEEEMNTYVLERSWNNAHHVNEQLKVMKNGARKEFLEENWLHFFEGILPSSIAKFFFFDGEKIAELAADQSNKELKQSIKALMGLTVLDQMNKDLSRLITASGKSLAGNVQKLKGQQAELNRLEDQKASLKQKGNTLEESRQRFEEKIISLEKKLELRKQDYLRKGGRIAEDRVKYGEELGRLSAQYDQYSSELRDLAAGALPLLMIQKDLTGLLEQVRSEEDQKLQNQIAEEIRKIASSYNRLNPQSSDQEIESFVSFVEQQKSEVPEKPIYDLDRYAVSQIESLNRDVLTAQKEEVVSVRSKQKQLSEQMEETKQYLTSEVDQEEIKAIQGEIKNLESGLEQANKDLLQVLAEKKLFESRFAALDQEIHRCKGKFQENREGSETERRTGDYAQKAVDVVQLYQKRLQKRRIQNLSEVMTECYRKLASKKNFIHRIEMNPDTLNLIYLDSRNNEVDPESLSAGEKQLMVIALLWALAKSSKRRLPVIIDTPLSRLDRQHRRTIVSEYYPVASEQIIILSTDTEITEEYYDMLKPYLDCEYSLEYDENEGCTRIRKGFFEGETVC